MANEPTTLVYLIGSQQPQEVYGRYERVRRALHGDPLQLEQNGDGKGPALDMRLTTDGRPVTLELRDVATGEPTTFNVSSIGFLRPGADY